MKTLANLKDATAIFALCAALTLSLTSCQKDELATPNSDNASFDQALPSRTFVDQTNTVTELNGRRDRLQAKPTEIGKSSRHKDYAHTGEPPIKIGDNHREQFNQPAIAKSAHNNKDNAHTGEMPFKISDNNREQINPREDLKKQDSRAPFNEPVQK